VHNDAVDSVIDHVRIPSSKLSPFEFHGQRTLWREEAGILDEVPVMQATVFGLDMLLHEPKIDLMSVSELVLSDVGATIHTLRLIGREYEFVAERPMRMCECIAGLDAGWWFQTISTRSYLGDREHPAATAVWEHCRTIAQCSRVVAESLDDISPDDAYMVGLLHGIGDIPAALGWSEGELRSAMPAMENALPLFVLAAMRSVNAPSCTSVWRFILTAAHRLAGVAVGSQMPVSCRTGSMTACPR
jgi:hypothetical protein